MTRIPLADVEAAAAEATEGPWHARGYEFDHGDLMAVWGEHQSHVADDFAPVDAAIDFGEVQ